jgi:N-acetylmuramoyl-L-alanine amidase
MLKKITNVFPFAVFVCMAPFWSYGTTAPTLDLVWPPEGHHYWALRSSFVFGSVHPPSARVTINGQPIPVYKTGAFLAVVPLSLGEFSFRLRAISDGGQAELTRDVIVDPPAEASPRRAEALDLAYDSPKEDVALSPGDWLRVVCKGPPKASAGFKIGEGRYHPMAEVEPREPATPAGLYKGDYQIPLSAAFNRVSIRFRLVTPKGGMIFGRAPGLLSVENGGTRRVCEMKDDLVTVTTGPDKDLGYEAFLPKGVLSPVTGSWGRYLRLGFGSRLIGWVDGEAVKILPEGTPLPHSVLGSLTVTTAAGSTLISLPLEAQQPFRVEQTLDPERFRLFLYGVTADLDKVRYESDASCVKEIRWRQVDENLCELDITTNQRSGWGYDVRYEGARMIFEVRHAPPLRRGLGRPLAGLVVAVDAGHNSIDPGATGPLRTHEDAFNLWLARQLEARLKSLGAEVFLTRKNDETLDLLQRTRLAWAARAHVFISLHANSIADSGNPLEDNGFSIHYWVPQSRPFAEAVHKSYQANIPLKDRGLWDDNLAVCRMTQMPSILTESAFIIVPEQEAMLLDPAFRDRIANTIAQGLQQYLKNAVP